MYVRTGEHPVFRREADDIYVTVPVAAWEAALGARIEVPTIDGRSQLRVPPGTQSGQKLRLREKGAHGIGVADLMFGGESVSVRAEIPADESVVAEKIPLDILHTDRHLFVLNKPVGLVVLEHRVQAEYGDSAVVEYFVNLFRLRQPVLHAAGA